MTLYTYGIFYHNLRDMPVEHRPSDLLMENDDKLDAWYKNFQAEQARKQGRTQKSNRYTDDLIPQYSEG